MKIASFTGATERIDIPVQKGFATIVICKTGTTAALANEKISVVLKTSGGEQQPIPTSKVSDVAMFSQFGAGYLLQEKEAGGNIVSEYFINVTRGASLELTNGEEASISLTGLQSTANYEVYGVENIVKERVFLKYVSKTETGTDPQQIARTLGANSQALYIKNNGGLEKIRLIANNGIDVTYTPKELAFLARQGNGMSIGPDTLVEGDSINQAISGGAKDWFYIGTENFQSYELHTVGGTEVVTVTTNVFGY